jgi:small basic protein (TIGR04137 family)
VPAGSQLRAGTESILQWPAQDISKSPLLKRAVPVFCAPFFKTLDTFFVMSQHRSLRASSSVGSKRSVLKRGERIKLLKSRGQWKEGQLPTNLPKTKPE